MSKGIEGGNVERVEAPKSSAANFMDRLEAGAKVDKPDSFKAKDVAGNHVENLEAKLSWKEIKYELAEVNPKYEYGEEWQINCQRCAPTYEIRRRGFDVTAQSFPYEDNWREDSLSKPDHVFKVWENPKVIDCKDNGKADIEKHMASWGDGARAEIAVYWKHNAGGHVFVAEQIDGKTHYFDPQDGSSDVSSYFKNVEPGTVKVCRTDNLKVTERIKECCTMNLPPIDKFNTV